MSTTRLIACLFLLFATGCQTCKPPTFTRQPDSADPWNTNYLIDADPSAVGIAALHSHAAALDEHYWKYSQVNGVLSPPWRTDPGVALPDRWQRGGDNCLFTGQALAAFSLRYGAEHSDEALKAVEDSLRGLWLLSHATGTPGAIVRTVIPESKAAQFGWPDEFSSRDPKFLGTGPALTDPFDGAHYEPNHYYSRSTKDQMTGFVIGLSAVYAVTEDATTIPAGHFGRVIRIRAVARQICNAVYEHLKRYDWRIRDQKGENDTSADYVDSLLRCGILALQVHMGNSALQAEYDEEFNDFIDFTNTLAIADRFNNYQQYFAFNLRTSRALGIYLLEGAGSSKGQDIADYMDQNIWRFTKGHKNGFFAFARALMTPSDLDAADEGVYSLKSLSLKPVRMWSSPYFGQEQKPNLAEVILDCHVTHVVDPHLRKPEDYSTWQKEPWDVGKGDDWDKEGLGDTSGLDYLLSYWLARYARIF